MRKVLLTTTALVALGGVSAASALDISGSYAFTYTDTSNSGASADAAGVSGDTFGNDMNIDFTNSITTDAGLTFGVLYRFNDFATEDAGITISNPEIGTFMAGQTDGFVDQMDGFMLGSSMAESGGPGTGNNTTNTIGLQTGAATSDTNSGNIGWRSNEMAGFQIAVNYEDGGANAGESDDISSWIVTYDFGAAKVGYASADVNSANDDGADTKETHYGGSTSFMGATINIGFGNEKDSATAVLGGATTSDVDTRDIGVSYDVDDNTSLYYVNVRSEENTGDNAGDKMESQAYGMYYTIAPGVTTNLEWAESDYTDATAGSGNSDARTATFAFLKVAF
jgi:hypothetical protein